MLCLCTTNVRPLLIIAALILAGCNKDSSHEETPKAISSPLVTVISIKPEKVTIIDELPGRVTAYRTAEIRPQVSGVIEKRLFEQGSDVQAGQELFQINAAPFKAEVDSATAVLQRGEAALTRVHAKFDRTRQLMESKAISRDVFEGTIADLAQAKASVAEARAALKRRRLDLDFATVRAPISGRIGQSMVSEGALVSSSNTNTLAIIQQIDRVYVDVRQPASQLDIIREAAASGKLHEPSMIPVEILGASGKRYPVTGKALFSEVSVDPGTGNVSIRVEVDNPDGVLLPGMFVRARLPRGVRDEAILVPQEAIVRDSFGRPQLLVMNPDKTASRRPVDIGDTINGRTIITSALKVGEEIIVQGQDRVQDGVPVVTTAFVASVATVKN